MDHPNIIKVYEVYQDLKFFYMIMEYFEGIDLFDYIRGNLEIQDS